MLEEVPLTARGAAGSRRRVAVPGARRRRAALVRDQRGPGPSGETMGFALDADDLVAAEASLRRFVETLTETFAHLPIGLAVFDKNRRLGLFNPALTELVKIDAVWLAGRPSLRDFLERLRETRQMPEQKDFASWRRKLCELEEGAREGTYEESWQLPSGKIFRVTGRPHPQGALAFLFEDISTSIMLERKYRSELELSQATLDRHGRGGRGVRRLGDAGLRQFRLRAALGARPDGAARRARRRRDDRALGRALRPEPGLGRGSPSSPPPPRTAPAGPTTVADPRRRRSATCWWRRCPTPRRSSSSATSRRSTAGAAGAAVRDPALDDLAFEQIVLPAEAAVQKLHAAIPMAPSPEAFQMLGAAAQSLKDGLARSRALRALAEEGGVGAGPAARARRRARPAPVDPGRAGGGRGLAAGPAPRRARPRARRGRARPRRRHRDARARQRRRAEPVDRDRAGGAAPGRAEGIGLALARRVIETAGGSLTLTQEADTATIVADLPLAQRDRPAGVSRCGPDGRPALHPALHLSAGPVERREISHGGTDPI